MFEVEELDTKDLTSFTASGRDSVDIHVEFIADKLDELIAAHNELAKYLEKTMINHEREKK